MIAPNYSTAPDGKRITLPRLSRRDQEAFAETARQISPSCGVHSLLTYAIDPQLVPEHVRAAIEAFNAARAAAGKRPHPHTTAKATALGARIP